MLPDNDRLTYLFHRYLDDLASEEEMEELGAYIRQSSEQSPLKAQITAVFQQIQTEESFDYVKWDEMFYGITGGPSLESAAPPAREVKIFSWTRAAAAAAILLLLGTGTYFLFFPGQKRPQGLVHSLQSNKNDVAAPNSVKAVLTLSNGHKIIIDSAEHGAIAMQGNTNIVKLANGQIAYNVAAKSTNEVMYNTLTVPRGSKVIAITLADGTKVWLNAASSLRYPTAFSGRERRVEITGEAYFEVMHNTNMPFIVENGGAEIQVLGTHFDVNAYDDEASMKVTLLEGSVRIIKGNSRQQLIPGQQAQVNADGKIALSNDVDKDEVMAWKNGEFQFDKTSIEVVMRQISRWYNVDITYQGVVTARFWGSISRNVNASEVLHMLEQTGTVRFRIEGRKVIVIPS